MMDLIPKRIKEHKNYRNPMSECFSLSLEYLIYNEIFLMFLLKIYRILKDWKKKESVELINDVAVPIDSTTSTHNEHSDTIT